MSEYIVCVDDLEKSYYRYTDVKPETVFGHRLREEIEREVERDYMRLPVDKNGETVHIGDVLHYEPYDQTFKVAVISVQYGNLVYVKECANGSCWKPEECTHYRKPAVEDVLRDVVTLCANTWKGGMSCFSHYTVDDMMESGNMHDFVDKLREVLRDE